MAFCIIGLQATLSLIMFLKVILINSAVVQVPLKNALDPDKTKEAYIKKIKITKAYTVVQRGDMSAFSSWTMHLL